MLTPRVRVAALAQSQGLLPSGSSRGRGDTARMVGPGFSPKTFVVYPVFSTRPC